MWEHRATFVSAHDGDTVKMTLDLEFGFSYTPPDGLRLDSTYAPELNQPGGDDTRLFVVNWLMSHAVANGTKWPFVVTTKRVADHEQETFGRFVATVTAPGDPISLNDAVNAYVVSKGYPRGKGWPA